MLGLGQRRIYNRGRPEVHDVYKRWRQIVEEYDPPRLLIGETWIHEPAGWAAFHGAQADELQLPMNFMFSTASFDPPVLRAVAERSMAELPEDALPVWHGSNHDVSRLATRWCGGDEGKVRLALTMLLTLPGVTILYQGDEIGLEDVPGAAGSGGRRRGSGPGADADALDCRVQRGIHHRRALVAARRPRRAQRGHAARRPRLTAQPDASPHRAQEAAQGPPYQGLPSPPGCWRYARGLAVVDLDFCKATAALQEGH